MSQPWQSMISSKPLPPKNVEVVTTYQLGIVDIRWEDPTILERNAGFEIIGVNIYRSDAAQQGPYRRINAFPLGGAFYQDGANYEYITREVVQPDQWVWRGDKPNDRKWQFKTQKPISKRYPVAPRQEITYADSPHDVHLYLNGEEIPVADVFGRTGEVTLVNVVQYDVRQEKMYPPRIPFGPGDLLEVSYNTPAEGFAPSGLDTHVWYRVTTVAKCEEGNLVESPLEWAEPKALFEVEKLDYIWREAMRRNAWILQQGGERVKVFVRKRAGGTCDCGLDPHTREYSKQPLQTCQVCFGTGFRGGYEGPYEIIIAPDDGERRVSQTEWGRRLEHSYEVWTGTYPLISQRDFIVKQTNERYSIGAVRRPSHRGNYLQQHFNIALLDESDVRYCVPIYGTDCMFWPETRGQYCVPSYTPQPVDKPMQGGTPWPLGPQNIYPMQTDKDEICDKHEDRGRTKVWENTTY